MQNFEIQFKPILTLCQQLYGPVIATLGPNWPTQLTSIIVTYLSTLPSIHPPTRPPTHAKL